MSTQSEQKRAVAAAAADFVVRELPAGAVLGVGTGSTADCFIDAMAARRATIAATVASSEKTGRRLRELGFRVVDLNDVDDVAIYVDGADEIDGSMSMIKGGGAALTREKIVAAVSRRFVCIADASKRVDVLGRFPLPVEVIPLARAYVARELAKLGGRAVRRDGVVTDNGNEILDVHGFRIDAPRDLEGAIDSIAGVVTNGIFARRGADVLLLARPEGVDMVLRD